MQNNKSIKFPQNLGNDVALLHHNQYVDVFYSEGWDTHARFRKNKTPKGIFISQVSGEGVPNFIFKYVISEVNK